MASIEENKMCRLCLQSNESSFYIFKENNNHGYIVSELIEDLLELQVSKKDHYPHFVCEKCLDKLIEFKNFKNQGHISKATYDNVFAADEIPSGDKGRQEQMVIVKAEPIERNSDDDEKEEECSYQVGQNGLETVENNAELAPVNKESDVRNESCAKNLDGEMSDICEMDLDRVTLLEENRASIVRGTSYKCQKCERTFSKMTNYFQHYKTHGSKIPFYCGYCRKNFVCKTSLDLHMRIHVGNKPYFCSYCEKRFRQKCRLDLHTRTHTGEKPYCCSICKKRFSNRGTLIRHEFTHTGERPFSCLKCEKKFVGKRNLIAHMRFHRKE